MIAKNAPAPPAYDLPHDGPRARTDLVVLHYTAGHTTATALRAMESRALSVQVVLERDGTLTRCAPDDARCRHAGSSSWGGMSSVNSRSLGVELVGFGYVSSASPGPKPWDPKGSGIRELEIKDRTTPGGWRDEGGVSVGTRSAFVWSTDKPGLPLLPDHRVGASLRAWTTYPTRQIDALVELLVGWLRRFDLPVESVVGHEHVAPGRKLDPGPAFPWAEVYRRLDCLVDADRDSIRHNRTRIVCMQSHLERLGCRPGTIDGVTGPRTTAALQYAVDRFGPLYGVRWHGQSADDGRAWCRQLVQVPGFDPGRGA